MIILRKYQEKLINDLRECVIDGLNRLIMQAATGAGKTVMFSFIVKNASENSKKCLMLTDRKELLQQAGGTFDKFGIYYENITAKSRRLPHSNVIVAMVETVKRRANKRLDFQIMLKALDLVIIDEAHKKSADSIFQYLNEKCIVIGATATPIRYGTKQPLSDYYHTIVEGVPIAQLISDGFLAKPRYIGFDVDLSTVKKKRGEFDESDMEKVYSDVKVFEGLKHNIEKYATGKKIMIFCPNVASSKNVAKELGCMHVDGMMSSNERDSVLRIFEETPGAIITNCGITTTGYDCPSIDVVILYRATTSLPLYLQMVGRGSRTTETKKEFIVMDFGMNIQRFGFWHVDRSWTLDGTKRNKDKLDVAPMKNCPCCDSILAAQARVCPYCGYEYPVKKEEKIFMELQELTYEEVNNRVMEADTIEEMEIIRESKGYKPGWLFRKFETKEQFEQYADIKGYKKGWVDRQMKFYLHR